MASVFTKIINGELPAYRIHEDELTISILTLEQVRLGHTLVIPKVEVNHWFDVPEESLLRVEKNAQKIAKAIKSATGCERVLKVAVGFEVHHYHLHLIPAWTMADLNFSLGKKFPEAETKEIQSKIISALR